MAANLTPKKSAFVLNLINAAAAAKLANDQLVVLFSEWQNQFNTGQSAAIVDADLLANTGTAHVTQAQLVTFFSGFQAALATATTNNLQGLLAVLPQ